MDENWIERLKRLLGIPQSMKENPGLEATNIVEVGFIFTSSVGQLGNYNRMGFHLLHFNFEI